MVKTCKLRAPLNAFSSIIYIVFPDTSKYSNISASRKELSLITFSFPDLACTDATVCGIFGR